MSALATRPFGTITADQIAALRAAFELPTPRVFAFEIVDSVARRMRLSRGQVLTGRFKMAVFARRATLWAASHVCQSDVATIARRLDVPDCAARAGLQRAAVLRDTDQHFVALTDALLREFGWRA